jgi:hypothetical protein
MTSVSPDARSIRAPRGSELNCLGWQQEGALRMLMNNLDAEVAEHPEELVVYGGTGKAARSWAAYDAIVRTLKTLKNDETLLVQSGSRSASCGPTSGHHGSSSPTPTWSATGPTGRSSQPLVDGCDEDGRFVAHREFVVSHGHGAVPLEVTGR